MINPTSEKGPSNLAELISGIGAAATSMFGDNTELQIHEHDYNARDCTYNYFDIWVSIPPMIIGRVKVGKLAWRVRAKVRVLGENPTEDRFARELVRFNSRAGARGAILTPDKSVRRHPRAGTAIEGFVCTDLEPTVSNRIRAGQYGAALADVLGAMLYVGRDSRYFKCVVCSDTGPEDNPEDRYGYGTKGINSCSWCSEDICDEHANKCKGCHGTYCGRHSSMFTYVDGSTEMACLNCRANNYKRCAGCGKRAPFRFTCDVCKKELSGCCAFYCYIHTRGNRRIERVCRDCTHAVHIFDYKERVCFECIPARDSNLPTKKCAGAPHNCYAGRNEQSITRFTPDARTKDGFSKYCVQCKEYQLAVLRDKRRRAKIKKKREEARQRRWERKEKKYGKEVASMSATVTPYASNWGHWEDTGGENSTTDTYYNRLVRQIKELENDNS